MARKSSKILGKRDANREEAIKVLEKDIAKARKELAKLEKALAKLVAKRKPDVPTESEPSTDAVSNPVPDAIAAAEESVNDESKV